MINLLAALTLPGTPEHRAMRRRDEIIANNGRRFSRVFKFGCRTGVRNAETSPPADTFRVARKKIDTACFELAAGGLEVYSIPLGSIV